MILLFTDFGSADLYTGQVKAVLAQRAPGVPVIDLLNDAPDFNVRASAHLLAALAPQFPPGSVFLAVVDPGVGSARGAVVVEADGRWFVGPDNGLMSVVAARAAPIKSGAFAGSPQPCPPPFMAATCSCRLPPKSPLDLSPRTSWNRRIS
ncbi:MAG: S-adenosyl-l-methionine hydroxide adenosyltransferase family protein [Betaproteobacteria bacterium]